jgi:DNA invertase Pin-like site-specific DNA recombinase
MATISLEDGMMRPRRKAFVYVRQSTGEQVENNTGSRAHQYAQTELAQSLGYALDQIEVIEDAGLSGSAADHRPEYQRMLAEIRADLVGLVIASDASRLSRATEEWMSFLCLCGIHQVKLVIEGKIIDPKRGDDRFFSGIMALAAEYDNHRRRETMTNGRRAKAKLGKPVTAPPAGYVRGPDGTWAKDERPGVQESIEAHFRAVLQERSLRRAVRLLREMNVQTPRRTGGGGIAWSRPTVNTLRRLVLHPAYVGDLVFGRRRVDPRLGRDPRGHYRLGVAPPDEVILTRDHHEPYVSREQLYEILQLLERNRWSIKHGVLGPGAALAQGTLRCGKHHNWLMRAMLKRPSASGPSPYVYWCLGETLNGGPACGGIPQWVIDTPLREELLARLHPVAIDQIAAALRQARLDAQSEAQHEQAMWYRLKREVDDLQIRYERVDPNHWAVAQALEKKLEQKKRELITLERARSAAEPATPVFDEDAANQLRHICSDIVGIFDAPTTMPRDRKELVRILINRIVVEERARERVRLRFVWNDGAQDTVHEVLLSPYANRIISEMAGHGVNPAAIANRLNEQGVKTRYQTSWSATNVRWAINRMRRRRMQEEEAE